MVRRGQSRQPLKKLRSFYSIETETLSLLSPLKGSFPSSSSLPPLPFSLLLSLPSCRFIFGGRVLDINCPASIVTGKHTVQLAQIPLLTTIQRRTTGPQVSPVEIFGSRVELSVGGRNLRGQEPLEESKVVPWCLVILSGPCHFPRHLKLGQEHGGKSN